MDEDVVKKICIDFINKLVRADVIKPEDLNEIAFQERPIVGADLQAYERKKKIAEYLNFHNSVSNRALSNWTRRNDLKFQIYPTLEHLLLRGKFTYKQRVKQCIYYIKTEQNERIKPEDILL